MKNERLLYFFALCFMALLLVIVLGVFAFSSRGQSIGTHYLILRGLYDFEDVETLPYASLRPMLWDETRGFYEISEAPDYLYTIVDYETQQHGYVLAYGDACMVFWMRPDLGADNQPHVALAEWVSCLENN